MFLTALPLFSENIELLTEQEKASSWTGMVKFAPEHARGKGTCFILYGRYPTPLMYKKYIPVSEDKSYVLQVSFRSLDPAKRASGYMGLQLLDKDKRVIGFKNVRGFDKTDTCTVSAEKGEKKLTVKEISGMKIPKRFSVAFSVRKDFSDLPNFEISPLVKSVTPDGKGNLLLELAAPLQKSYPAGTAVRFHSPWSPSMYYLGSGWVPEKGVVHKVVIKGISKESGTPVRKFWKGTKYVRPFVWFGNWNRIPGKDAKLLVDGFSFEACGK